MNADAHSSANKERHTRSGVIARWHLRSVNEAIYKMITESGAHTVLDAGCGEGFVLDYVARRDPGLELKGIDVDANAIAYARKHFDHAAEFSGGSLLALPYEDDSFDTVLCSEVLEHVEEWDAALSELKRVARQYVIITVPHEPFFRVLNDFARAMRLCQDPGHINFWHWGAFKKMISRRFSGATFQRKHLIYQLALGRL